jgi:ATP-dependent Lon protease
MKTDNNNNDDFSNTDLERQLIQKKDNTKDEKKMNAIKSFQELSSNNTNTNLPDLLDLYKVVQSVVKDDGFTWVIYEIEEMITNSRNPLVMRVSKVCVDLRGMLPNKEIALTVDDDDDEDDYDDDEIEFEMEQESANILLAIFNAAKQNAENEEDNLPTGNLSTFKKLLVNFNKAEREDETLKFFKGLPDEKQDYYINIITKLKDKLKTSNTQDLPYLFRLMDFKMDDTTKQTIIDNVTAFEKLSPSASDYNKRKNFINGIKRLPFGKSATPPVELLDAMGDKETVTVGGKRKRENNDKMMTYLQSVEKNMDKAIYGHKETKNQTMRLIASMVANGSSKGGNCFAMCGPPGTGKTQIAGEIAKALGRPCVKLNLGGASNGDDLVGHGYTYEGSTYGLIARAMMDAGCENPVIIFDELDKVSRTPKGDEINNVLIHLTDSTQNMAVQDKYFAGINIDLSKVIMVFSFNDRSNISPILLDRMKVINVGGYKINDKVVIAKKHLIPSIKKELGYNDCDYVFDDTVIRDMINQYTFEGGVRKIKELITDVMMEINLRKMTGLKVGGLLPTPKMTITNAIIQDDIFKDRHRVQHTMASKVNKVGLVNGLWANSYGVGGLIPVEAHIVPSASKFELKLTGMQGNVMKESMNVAKTVAWRLLPETRKKELMKSWKDDGPTGIHIHCPDGSTPKDGPSAGGAITTCIISLLTGKHIDQSYAMTGEINLQGDISEIGGLEEKTFGAIAAGVKTILYPFGNKRDHDKIKEKFPDIFDPSSTSYIKMIPIRTIEEILEIVLVSKN